VPELGIVSATITDEEFGSMLMNIEQYEEVAVRLAHNRMNAARRAAGMPSQPEEPPLQTAALSDISHTLAQRSDRKVSNLANTLKAPQQMSPGDVLGAIGPKAPFVLDAMREAIRSDEAPTTVSFRLSLLVHRGWAICTSASTVHCTTSKKMKGTSWPTR
jgi:hypothetical protein